MSRLTQQGEDRRSAMLTFIKGYIAERGYPPTNQEIADGTGISKTVARRHLQTLAEGGLITWDSRIPRSIQVL